MLVAIGSIAYKQANPSEKAYNEYLWILNYAASHQDTIIKEVKSDMVLYIHSDTSYLSEPKACSCVGGHFLRSYAPIEPSKLPIVYRPLNGSNHSLS